MKDKGMSEEDKKFQAEVERIMETYPDGHMFDVPIIITARLHKMRYLGYLQMLKAMEKNTPPEHLEKSKEDFKIACFCAGLDEVVSHMCNKLMGEMLKGMMGTMLKDLDKEDDD